MRGAPHRDRPSGTGHRDGDPLNAGSGISGLVAAGTGTDCPAACLPTLKAIMGPVERTALLFGWNRTVRADEISDAIDHINSELKRLHP